MPLSIFTGKAGAVSVARDAPTDPRAARAVLLETADKRKPAGLAPTLLTTPDNITLRCATARPQNDARGTVVILPGRGDYIERHYETINDLLSRRFAVVVFDWRGQGLSQRLLANRLKGHVRDFAHYETDLATVMRRLVLPEFPAPHVALAISMGGHVLLKASWRHAWFARAMLISPFIDFPHHPHERWLKLLVQLGPYLGLSRLFFPGLPKRLLRASDFEHNALTSDRARFLREVRFLQQYPDVGVAMAPTIGWMHAALTSVRQLRRMVATNGEPHWPMLALAAAHDRLVNPQALRRLAQAVGNVEAIFLHQTRHDITMERDEIRALFWAAFDAFVEEVTENQQQFSLGLAQIRRQTALQHLENKE